MSTGRTIKTQLYEHFARIGKALDSPQRLELLDLLCQCERTVEDLAREANLTVANTSRHLQILKASRMVDSRKEGVKVYYRLGSKKVCDLVCNLRTLAKKNLAEVEQLMTQYFTGGDDFQPVDRQELTARANRGEVIILDVRPEVEYDKAHLPLAKSLPLPQLRSRLAELPQNIEIVAYCRGPYCVLAQEAVNFLKQSGYIARRLVEGVNEWRDAGLEVIDN